MRATWHNLRVPALSARQLLGVLLLCLNVAAAVWWMATDRRLPDLPTVTPQAVDAPVPQRPLGLMEPWARAAAAAATPRLPAVLRVGDQRARVERHGTDGIVCPPQTGGCLLIRPGRQQVLAAYGAGARVELRSRLGEPSP